MAYDRIEPIGEIRADMRMAVLATVVARSAGSKTAKPDDFMPKFDAGLIRQDPEELQRKMFAFAEQHNAHNAERRRRAGK